MQKLKFIGRSNCVGESTGIRTRSVFTVPDPYGLGGGKHFEPGRIGIKGVRSPAAANHLGATYSPIL